MEALSNYVRRAPLFEPKEPIKIGGLKRCMACSCSARNAVGETQRKALSELNCVIIKGASERQDLYMGVNCVTSTDVITRVAGRNI